MLNETDIIQFLKSQHPSHIGDDAAVLGNTAASEHRIITQDLLIEDVHFRRRYQDATSLAQKALQVNLSDLAAMGAKPEFILLALSIPQDMDTSYLEAFLHTFTTACHENRVTLIGGDTTRSPHAFLISVTAIGSAPLTQIKYRHQAQPGDWICVLGNLGFAHLGFTALEQNAPDLMLFKQAFLNPKAHVLEGQWFGKQSYITSMMDLSDGLITDLKKLTEASHMGAHIETERLQTTQAFQQACQSIHLDPIETQLIGAEDYGLLFTIQQDALDQLRQDFKQQFHQELLILGTITETPSIQITNNKQPITLNAKPFEHF